MTKSAERRDHDASCVAVRYCWDSSWVGRCRLRGPRHMRRRTGAARSRWPERGSWRKVLWTRCPSPLITRCPCRGWRTWRLPPWKAWASRGTTRAAPPSGTADVPGRGLRPGRGPAEDPQGPVWDPRVPERPTGRRARALLHARLLRSAAAPEGRRAGERVAGPRRRAHKWIATVPWGHDFEKIRYIPGIYDSVELILTGSRQWSACRRCPTWRLEPCAWWPRSHGDAAAGTTLRCTVRGWPAARSPARRECPDRSLGETASNRSK